MSGISESFAYHRRQQEQFGGLITPQQRAAAQRRAETQQTGGTNEQKESALSIDWSNTEYWRAGTTQVAIKDFADGGLWSMINWMTRNREWLFALLERHPVLNADVQLAHSRGRAASVWLGGQPLFRRLVRESIRRDLSFPPDVFAFLKQLLSSNGTFEDYVPWKDPDDAYQARELRALDRDMSSEEFYGRPLRSIRL